MMEIKPFVEALVNEEEFLAGTYNHYMILNVLANNGDMYRFGSLSANRHILRKVASTQMKAVSQVTQLRESKQFLPNGQKIPMEMLDQIVAFFKAVMRGHNLGAQASAVGTETVERRVQGTNHTPSYGVHGDYEAMIHVVWNKDTKEYRLAVPTQRVSKGSVSYDRDHLLEGDEIILDIHSHNTMGAFFSGTDNNDDKSGFYLSGVAGQLNLEKPAFVWRFNNGAEKIEVTMDEIFGQPARENFVVPQEWLSKVTVNTYSSLSSNWKPGGYTSPAVTNRRYLNEFSKDRSLGDFDDIDYQRHGAANRGSVRLQAQGSLQETVSSVTDKGIEKSAQTMAVYNPEGTVEKKPDGVAANRRVPDAADLIVHGFGGANDDETGFSMATAQDLYDLMMDPQAAMADVPIDTADILDEIVGTTLGLDDDDRIYLLGEIYDQVQDKFLVNGEGFYVARTPISAIETIKELVDNAVLPSPQVRNDLVTYIENSLRGV